MKKLFVMILFFLIFSSVNNVSASELTLIDSGICTGVLDHKAVGVSEAFSRDVGKLFCFTRVVGPYLEEKEPHIVHVWYYKNVERARISLPLKSSNWGTYSSKIIRPFETGSWHVEVLDPEGARIAAFQFYIKE